jgi:hypothetical protein
LPRISSVNSPPETIFALIGFGITTLISNLLGKLLCGLLVSCACPTLTLMSTGAAKLLKKEYAEIAGDRGIS